MRWVLDLASACAAPLGFQPSSWAIFSTLARVSSETPDLPFNAYETALLETPEALATSKIVTLLFCTAMLMHPSSSLNLSDYLNCSLVIIQQKRHQTYESKCLQHFNRLRSATLSLMLRLNKRHQLNVQ